MAGCDAADRWTGNLRLLPSDKRYGTASTIAALYEVGRIWRLRRAAPRVGVGDISLRGGGVIDGHASHETGRDVDQRPMKNDGTEGPVTWAQAKYSHSLTQELIDIIYANGVVMVKVIGFNYFDIERRELGQPRQPFACAVLLRR